MKVDDKPTSKVAGPIKTGKYAGIVAIAIIAAVIGHSFMSSSNKAPLPQSNNNIQTAAASDVKLDLGSNVPTIKYPVLPMPPTKSVLPPDIVNSEENAGADSQRVKSPSLVYSAATAPGANTSSTTGTASSSGGNANAAFSDQAGNAKVVTVSAKQQTNTDYKVFQGKIIPAVLETAINSDLPGMTRAVVNEDVYGETGNVVLLPKGTRLIGQYNSAIAVGQTRVYIIWSRAITPSGVDIMIGSPSTNALGEAGMGGVVDNHFWKIFGTSMLMSVLGAGASYAAQNNSSSANGVYGNPYATAVTTGVLNNSTSILQTNINIQPTIHVAQGSVIKVFVARDLDFSTVMSGGQLNGGM